jgi:hypothetical protein
MEPLPPEELGKKVQETQNYGLKRGRLEFDLGRHDPSFDSEGRRLFEVPDTFPEDWGLLG